MKKQLFILFFLLAFVPAARAQSGEMSQDDLKKIKASTTYFVLEEAEGSKYNAAMRESADKFWKLTPFEFIKFSQLAEYVKKPNASFVLKLVFEGNGGDVSPNRAYGFNPTTGKVEHGTLVRNGPSTTYRYDGIVLVLGDRKKPEFSFGDWLAYTCVNDVSEVDQYYFKVGSSLQVIQHFAALLEKHGDKTINFSKGKEYYNSGVVQLKDKVLYLRKADMPEGFTDINRIKEVYKYQVKFASDAEVQAAIASRDPNAVILHAVVTGNRFYPYFTETKNGQVIYLDLDRNYLINPAKSMKKLLAEVGQ